MRFLGAMGEREMAIDHFDPRLKRRPTQRYSNLYLADSSCNGFKTDTWPSCRLRKRGVRFLDCCAEADYDTEIFEDPQTHRLVGTTPAAIYHIRNIDLNAPHLVRERADRARLHAKLRRHGVILREGRRLPGDLLDEVRRVLDRHIPMIDPPPVTAAAQPQPAGAVSQPAQ
jgi:hypothetical protein